MTRQQQIPGTDLGYPVPISEEVWAANVDPQLPVEGPLMTMLAHDCGLPVLPCMGERQRQAYHSTHVVGYDLGAYGPSADRAMIAGRTASAMLRDIDRVFVTPREWPA